MEEVGFHLEDVTSNEGSNSPPDTQWAVVAHHAGPYGQGRLTQGQPPDNQHPSPRSPPTDSLATEVSMPPPSMIDV